MFVKLTKNCYNKLFYCEVNFNHTKFHSQTVTNIYCVCSSSIQDVDQQVLRGSEFVHHWWLGLHW